MNVLVLLQPAVHKIEGEKKVLKNIDAVKSHLASKLLYACMKNEE